VSNDVPSREDIQRQFEGLHARGVIDLEAPLRDSVVELARYMNRYVRPEATWWIVTEGENPHAVCECQW
jgi:hypothetical protein